MPPLTNSKHEIFTQNWFSGKTKEKSALIAGYKPKWIRSIGSKLSTNVNIMARYNELMEEAKSDKVMDKQQRMERLSEIARASLPDYMTEEGIKVDKDSPNVAAVAELTSKARVYRKTGDPINITNIKLHNPMTAIDLLNKMDKLYSEGVDGYQDNRTVNIIVSNEKAKELTENIARRLIDRT